MTSHDIGAMSESVKELIAIGASVGAHCQKCLEYHVQMARKLGVSKEDIHTAIDVGHMIEKGAMSTMKAFSTQFLDGGELSGKSGGTSCCGGSGCC